ncbi:MAG TPA: ATP-grasp domain-containing protein [Acidobacteriaceae bacterium]|nr:ATP-grasp domain-containing protein [Acidobacteriaceae bacterium]
MNTTGKPRIFCISSYEKGQAFLEECAALGCRVVLLTVDKLRHADWPRSVLEDFHTMPEGLTLEQITNTVTYLSRAKRFDRIVALDEFDLETVAHLREHMRIPGMGRTLTAHFRDKLVMREKASEAGFLVPDFTRVLVHNELRAWMERVPAPWVLKPRSEASAIGIKKMHAAADVWRTLQQLGDRQSFFVLERFVPGDIFHVDAIVSEGQVVLTSVSGYGKPPMQVMHEGGVFTTRVLDRASDSARELTALNARLMPALGMVRGVTHAEYIRAKEDGRFYFLEAAARVGGAFIADVIEAATSVNLWREWARIEVAHLRGDTYRVPQPLAFYAGSVLCLAKTAEPDTRNFFAPEIVLRLKKHHHAGLIVRSEDPERIRALLEEFAEGFAREFLATAPVPEKPTA